MEETVCGLSLSVYTAASCGVRFGTSWALHFFTMYCLQILTIVPLLRTTNKRHHRTKNFWKKGLSQAWGDPKRLTPSDVLRFQWPSIGKGWERGLLSFSRAIQSEDDVALLKRVVNLPNVTVVMVYGSKDNVVKVNEKMLHEMKCNFPMVKVVRMEGLGHDPFEEDKDAFLAELERVLQTNTNSG